MWVGPPSPTFSRRMSYYAFSHNCKKPHIVRLLDKGIVATVLANVSVRSLNRSTRFVEY